MDVMISGKKGHRRPLWERERGFLSIVRLSAVLFVLLAAIMMEAPSAAEATAPSGGNDPQLPPFAHVNKAVYLRKRAEYFATLRGWERGRPFDPGMRLKALRQMKAQRMRLLSGPSDKSGLSFKGPASNVPGQYVWTPIGPAPIPNGQTDGGVTNPVSGRVTAIAVHPSNPDIVYVGTAQGGVYRTLDGGTTWTAIFDSAESLSIGAVTIDPVDPSIVFVGTGEGNSPGGGGCFFGVGVYRIDDADTSAVLNGPFDTRVAGTWTSAGNGHAFLGTSITSIVVDPNNDNRIFVGNTIGGFGNAGSGDYLPPGSSNPATAFLGLYFSPNALSASPTFSRIALPPSAGYSSNGFQGVTDMAFAPGSSDNMVVGVADFYSENSALSGIYTTTNASVASQGSPGAVPSFSFVLGPQGGQSSYNPSNTKFAVNKVGSTVTVLAATNDSAKLDSSGSPLGQLYESTDGGATFKVISSADGFCGQQCFYDMAVAIDPGNPGNIYLGGMSNYGSGPAMNFGKSTDGGATFAESDKGLHTDTHAIAVAPSDPAIIYTGNDGGIFKSVDYGATWTSLNNQGFSATQFQSLALHPTDRNFLIGGTQDNGTNWYRPDGTWFRADYGDGGSCAIDQNAADTTDVRMYHTYYNEESGLIGFAAVDSTASATDGNWTFYGCSTDDNDDCTCNNGLSCGDNALFYPPLALGPGDPNTLYFGTDTLYRSVDGGITMAAVSQAPLDMYYDSPISAIGISPQDDRVRMAGLQDGAIFYTAIGSDTLISLKPTGIAGFIPDSYITRVVVDPGDKYTAYVTLAAYFGGTQAWQSHIWKITDLNETPRITPINGLAPNNLPDVPISALAVDINDPTHPGVPVLYAGTDIGVYQSVDEGANWTPFGTGLPRVPVFDMGIHKIYRTLRVATYGRGLWEIGLPAATFSIAGTARTLAGAAIPGVTMTLSGDAQMKTATDGEGGYAFTGLYNGNYTITPGAQGYSFAPAGTAVSVTSSDITGVDFTGATYSISGTVRKPGGAGIAKVLMTLSGTVDKTVYTDSYGAYSFPGLAEGSYIITPDRQGFTFTPANKQVSISGASIKGRNFTGTK